VRANWAVDRNGLELSYMGREASHDDVEMGDLESAPRLGEGPGGPETKGLGTVWQQVQLPMLVRVAIMRDSARGPST